MKNKRPGIQPVFDVPPDFEKLAKSRGMSDEDANIIGKVGDYAYEQEMKALKERSLLEEEVGKITLGEFLDALGRESKERVELAKVLRDLNKAIDNMELTLSSTPGGKPEAERQMERFKQLRETFNRIPAKWFHS